MGTQVQSDITKTYNLDIKLVKWNKNEIFLAVIVFLFSFLVMAVVYCVHLEGLDKKRNKSRSQQFDDAQHPEDNCEMEEVDEVDGPSNFNSIRLEFTNNEPLKTSTFHERTLKKAKGYYETKKWQFKNNEEFDSNGYWIPIIFTVLTFIWWLCVVITIYFQTHAFDSTRDNCFRNYKCSKSLPGPLSFIPVSKAISSLIYVGIGVGWMAKGWTYFKKKTKFYFSLWIHSGSSGSS